MKCILTAIICSYRKFLSPLFGSTCRFRPTCSQFALNVINDRGYLRAMAPIAKRLLSCHPFGKSDKSAR